MEIPTICFFCQQENLTVEYLLTFCSNLNNHRILVYGRGNLDFAKTFGLEIIIEKKIDFLNREQLIDRILKYEFMFWYIFKRHQNIIG